MQGVTNIYFLCTLSTKEEEDMGQMKQDIQNSKAWGTPRTAVKECKMTAVSKQREQPVQAGTGKKAPGKIQ